MISVSIYYIIMSLSSSVSSSLFFSSSLFLSFLLQELLRWYITVINSVILPSLSLLQCNCGMAEEVWSMIRLLPYETR